MDPETASRTIQLILAPVVMVSACAAILNGLLSRYGGINDRLRNMAHERLDLLREGGGKVVGCDEMARERLYEIDTQAPELLKRHKKVRNAVLAVYSAISVFVLSMFVIALAAATKSRVAAVVALSIFLLGTAVLLTAAVITVLEVKNSHKAMHYETERVLGLGNAK
jgi:hypothetical protein